MSNTILETNSLSKKYHNVQALKDLNIKVQKGMVFGILGPNGSGKTTTLGILLGILNATEGSFSWFGNGENNENRKRIGALLETPNFYPYLDAVKNLKIVSMIKKMDNADERIETVLKQVNLYDRRYSTFRTFSLGMKQRLAIASALLNNPEVLVLDEPTNGLDPQGIAEIRNLIVDVAKAGKTILIASHQLDEIEKICTDVLILQNGVAIRQSGIENILDDTRQIIISCEDISALRPHISEIQSAKINEIKRDHIILDVNESIKTSDINRYFFEKGIVLSELREIRKSLEDQFLEITKK
jgi:ABC-type multidrug transport system ATPase subunit